MTDFGYTMMTEQSPPDQLIRDLQMAEKAGFDFSVTSDQIAVSRESSCALAGHKADLMVAVEPTAELGEMFDAAGGAGKPRVGQVALAYDADRDRAIERAQAQFRWFGLGWKVHADLPWSRSALISRPSS